MLGGAMISFLIAESFRNEDQKWYNLTCRAIFIMFAIGFVALAIGVQGQMIQETGIENTLLNETVLSGITLITRMQYTFFVLIFIIVITTLIYKILIDRKSKLDPYT